MCKACRLDAFVAVRSMHPAFSEMVSIHVRPPEIEDRLMPGHWEGDLIKGAGNKSAVAVLIERMSRAVLLAKMPDSTAVSALQAFTTKLQSLVAPLRQSMADDQGREMSRHAVDLSIDDDLVRLVSHLPFDCCAVCFVDADGRRAMLALNQGASSVTAAGFVDVGGGKMEPIQPLAYALSEAGIHLLDRNGAVRSQERREQAYAILAVKAEQKRLSFTSETGFKEHGMLVFPVQECPHESADT